ILSNEADLDRVDDVRAGCDAILVGAGTIRADDPRLLVRSALRRSRRVAAGRPASPHKVTLTRHASLHPAAQFFADDGTAKFVYCASGVTAAAGERLGTRAKVIDAGPEPTMRDVSVDLGRRGVRRLLVEGGQAVHTQFICAGLADELHVVVAPIFVGDSRAHRVVADGPLPWNRDRRARLCGVRQMGDVVLMRYALSDRCAAAPTGEFTVFDPRLEVLT
ncbi:RibD family protein, partial [Kribbia dieselivorans]|uniref:RibD family protein n=1 Tax=Kribbia dieselivorans TaxID=331526 RepID=UPI000A4FF987